MSSRFLKRLYTFETSSRESGLDDSNPCAYTIHFFSYLLPLENPSSIDPVGRFRYVHSLETLEIMPSLEFFELGLIHLLGVSFDLLLG